MRCMLMASSLLMAWSAQATAPKAPVAIVTGARLTGAEGLLLTHAGASVVKKFEALPEELDDLYAVALPQHFAVPPAIEAFGEIVDFKPGHLAVMRVGREQVAPLSAALHAYGMACGALVKLSSVEAAPEATAAPQPRIPIEQRDARAAALAARVQSGNISSDIRLLSSMDNRFHNTPSGRAVAERLASIYRDLAGGRRDVSLTIEDHGRATEQPSLIVRISGQVLPDEVIILGSHLDSVNWRQSGDAMRAPGADDNASGTATNLEIFRQLMAANYKLERTLEIHAYAAEEIGLVGSEDIAQKYKARGIKVVAMVQHDMTAYKAPGTEDKIWLVRNNTNAGFNEQLARLVPHYAGIAYASANLTSGSSDHASWHRAGFVAAFPFENPGNYNRHIHTASDTLEAATAITQAAGFARLGIGFVAHFGGLATE